MSKRKIISPMYHLESLGNNPLYGLRARMNDEQENFCQTIMDHDITFSNSPSGTGKTTLAVAMAKLMLEYRIVSSVVYLFAPIQEHSMGHRPGFQMEKNAAYLDPLYDALVECGEQLDKGLPPWVKAEPHTFLRGVNFQNAFIIIDEAQNMTKPELKKILTRVHTEYNLCKVAVVGHTGQIDLKRPSDSGLAECIEHFSKDKRAGIANLSKRNYRGWLSEHADKW